jgi:hypothetical protein
MTSHRDFKAIIRARMAITGQSYTSARVDVLREQVHLFGISQSNLPTSRYASKARVSCRHSIGTPLFSVACDLRYELVAIMGRLAGYGYFNGRGGRQSAYAAQVDAHFSAFKEHPAVKALAWLRENRGFYEWYLLTFGVRLSDVATLNETLPLEAPNWDAAATWTLEDLSDFREKLRDFVVESDLCGFLGRNIDRYAEAARRLRANVDDAKFGNWIRRFLGTEGQLQVILVSALLAQGRRMAAINEFSDGRIELFGFLGPYGDIDELGIPSYGSKLEFQIVEMFCRMRIYAEVSIHEPSLRSASEETFAATWPDVTLDLNQWHSMMSQALMMAMFSQFIRRNSVEISVRQLMHRFHDNHLAFWRQPLAELFEEFEDNRELYPKLGDFMPRVTAFFVDFAAKTRQPDFSQQRQLALQSVASIAPKIIRANPPRGATDVDPELSVVTIEFDRRMSGDATSLPVSNGKFPQLIDQPRFDETNTTYSLRVSLDPETDYAILLCSHNFLGFADDKGNPLIPTTYCFRTGPRRELGN